MTTRGLKFTARTTVPSVGLPMLLLGALHRMAQVELSDLVHICILIGRVGFNPSIQPVLLYFRDK